MRTRQTIISISLPPEMAEQIEKVVRLEQRTRSELIREAIGFYIAARRLPEEEATPAEARAVQRGRAAYRRGEYVTLDALRNADNVASRHRRTRAKVI